MTSEPRQSVEACWDPGGRVAFFPILPATDRPPIGCVGCRKPLDGTFPDGMGFFVETSYPDGSGIGCMAVCAQCAAEAMRPRELFLRREVKARRAM